MDDTTYINVKNDLEKFGVKIQNFQKDCDDSAYFDKYLRNIYRDIIINKLKINDEDKILAIIVYIKYNFMYNLGRKGLYKIVSENDIDTINDIFIEMKIEDKGYGTELDVGNICKVSTFIGRGNYYRWFVIIEKLKDRMKVMELLCDINYPLYKYIVKDNDLITEIRKHKKFPNSYVLACDIKKRNPHRINSVILGH